MHKRARRRAPKKTCRRAQRQIQSTLSTTRSRAKRMTTTRTTQRMTYSQIKNLKNLPILTDSSAPTFIHSPLPLLPCLYARKLRAEKKEETDMHGDAHNDNEDNLAVGCGVR